jgi:hypothetical protein
MAPSAASIAKLAEGLTRVPRPISAAPVPSVSAIAQNATPRVLNSATRSIESGLSRAVRPYPYTAVSQSVGLERAAMGRAETALNTELIALQRQQAQAILLEGQVASATESVGAALRPTAAASKAVSGFLTRVPLVGTVLQKAAPVARFAGPFLAVYALQSIPQIFEYFAPGVHDWLLGGWKQNGNKANELPPGVGQSAVLYTVTAQVEDYDPGQERWVDSRVGLQVIQNVLGPIGSVKAPYEDGNGRSVCVYSPTGQNLGSGSALYGSSGTYRIKWVSIQRADGTTEGTIQGGQVQTAPNPPKKSTVTNPASTNIPENAKNAAIAAVAVTIAAGKYRTQPPPSRDALKTPQKKFGTQLAPTPTQTAPATQPCKGNACGQAGLDQSKQNGEDLKKLLDALQLLGIGDIKKTVDRIDNKVGPQIYDNRGNKIGIAGHALKMFEKLNKVGDYLRFDRITNVLTLAATVHNAAMLSNQLEQTLASALSNGLAAIGVKDSEGNPLDINSIVGKSVEGAIKGAIGAENYTELTTNWKKANRIYQAGANLINNVQSLRYSITGALETIASMNGKVANALKKYGVLGDNAYPWMNPNPNFDNKFMRGLETAENAVSNIDSIASEVLSAQETVTEIGKQKTELATALKDGTEKAGINNTQQKEKATAAKAASKSPDIVSDNLIKPES